MCNHCCCMLGPMSKALASPSNRLIGSNYIPGRIHRVQPGYSPRWDNRPITCLYWKLIPKRERHDSSIACTRFELPDSDLAKPRWEIVHRIVLCRLPSLLWSSKWPVGRFRANSRRTDDFPLSDWWRSAGSFVDWQLWHSQSHLLRSATEKFYTLWTDGRCRYV